MSQLIALDLDGTTLDSSNALSSVTFDTITSLSNEGVKFAILTGRAVPGVYPHVASLSLPVNVPVVCYNGCCGYVLRAADDGSSAVACNEVLFELGLEREDCRALIHFAVSHGHVLQVSPLPLEQWALPLHLHLHFP